MKTLAEELKALREALGLDVLDAAFRMQLGPTYLESIESGEEKIPYQYLFKFSSCILEFHAAPIPPFLLSLKQKEETKSLPLDEKKLDAERKALYFFLSKIQ